MEGTGVGKVRSPDALMLFQEPEGFPNDLAGGGVAPGLYLLDDKRFQFRRERDVRADLL
jgi:hypothetical protein